MARDMTGKRAKLIEIYGHNCQVCDYDGFIEVHHLTPVCEEGTHDLDNLVLLCEKCHANAHGYKKKKWIDRARERWNG